MAAQSHHLLPTGIKTERAMVKTAWRLGRLPMVVVVVAVVLLTLGLSVVPMGRLFWEIVAPGQERTSALFVRVLSSNYIRDYYFS